MNGAFPPLEEKRRCYEPRTVRSVSHAAVLLRAIAHSDAPPSLSALARKAQLSKPATYVLLNTLIAEGLIHRTERGGYEMSWSMYEMAGVLDRSEQLKQAARFPLDRLAKVTQGAALISVLDGSSVLYLDRGQENLQFATTAGTGRRASWHTTASGKVLMASRDDSTIRIHLGAPLPARTPASITTPDRLLQQLSRARVTGYAESRGEHEALLSSVAVPLRDAHGRICASVAVAIPSTRYDARSTRVLVEQLHACAREVQGALR